ncbi:MAG: hypothetical protein WKG00_16135 [Polyangiaceae bacterium]
MKPSLSHCLLATALVLAACEKTPEPDPTSSPSTSKPAQSAAPAPAGGATATAAAATGPADIAWDVPAAWERMENPSPMRKATYKIPKAAGDKDDGDMSVSQAGGGIDANVKRWEQQFTDRAGETKTETKKVGDLEVTIVEVKGTFASGMPGMPAAEPKKSWALLGAIVNTKTPYFFKLTGPDKTVTAARADFDKLVNSLRAK